MNLTGDENIPVVPMTEIGRISVNLDYLTHREYRHIADAIDDIRRPYEKLIDKYCSTRRPRMILNQDGTIVNEWDHTTQSFINTTNRHMVNHVREYLRGKGL
jgi:hypothetical protein